MFAIGCTNKANEDTKDIEDQILTLNISTSSDESLIATEGNSGIRYQISNSQVNIRDDKGNSLSWNELKDAKIIEIH